MSILAEGEGAYLKPDPDGFRAWVRDHKPRTLVNKLMSEQEAVVRFVSGGAYSRTTATISSVAPVR